MTRCDVQAYRAIPLFARELVLATILNMSKPETTFASLLAQLKWLFVSELNCVSGGGIRLVVTRLAQ